MRAFRPALPYLLSLVLPATTFSFFLLPAYRGYVAVAWGLQLLAIAIGDELLPRLNVGSPPASRSMAPLADVVALVQVANFGLFVGNVGRMSGSDALLAALLLGIGSAFSSMIAAHELVHQRGARRWLGRILLSTVLYEHFFVDHLRGHHRAAGTAADVLTARRHESFWSYLARSWPGEVRRAWCIERARNANRSRFGALAANDVVRGLVLEVLLLAGAAAIGGPRAAGIVVAQAALAHVLVVAVNFLEHWGIDRAPAKFGPTHAWDATAPLSHYALLGLSFHVDHHIQASRPFDRLVLHAKSPKLPYGYFAMVALVVFRNARARRLLGGTLSRHQAETA